MIEYSFVKYLIQLAEKGDKRTLAVFKRGLGKENGTPEMYPYVFMFSPKREHESSFFLVGSLFGFHPSHSERSLGYALGALRVKSDSDGIEKRFERLMHADRKELPVLLRHVFAMLKSNKISLNYHRLLNDVIYFGENVKKQWARDFWGTYKNTENDEKGE